MELTGDLKELVEKAETREEAKKIIEEAGISLTDEGAGSGGWWFTIRDICLLTDVIALGGQRSCPFSLSSIRIHFTYPADSPGFFCSEIPPKSETIFNLKFSPCSI